jgi:ABC-type hemin transport system substrate-binding protein
MVFLASAVPLAITPAAADIHYEIPGDVNPHDDKLTKDELVSMILPYMLDEGAYTLDDVGDAAYVYTNWDGEPKTVMEINDRVVTFYRPIERVASPFAMQTRVLNFLGACDRLVGVSHSCIVPEEEHACGGLLKLPNVERKNPEFSASLRLDLLAGHIPGDPETYQKKVYTPCLRYGDLSFTLSSGATSWRPTGEVGRDATISVIRFYGEVLDMQEDAEDVISYINEEYDKVSDITSQIPDSEKPRACDVKGKGVVSGGGSSWSTPYSDAGAISLRTDLGVTTDISVEELVKWNPDVIFIKSSGPRYSVGGFRETSLSLTVEQVLEDPQLQTVNAVKTGSVYYITGPCHNEVLQRVMTGAMYMAKIFYPDKFKDMDLEKEGNEIFKRFFGVDGLYTEFADNLGYFRESIDNPPEQGKWQNVPE